MGVWRDSFAANILKKRAWFGFRSLELEIVLAAYAAMGMLTRLTPAD